MKDVKEKFADRTIESGFPVKEELFSLPATSKAVEVFLLLAEKNIFCIPLMADKKPAALIDMVDLVIFIVKIGDITKRMGGLKKLLAQDKLFETAFSVQVSDISHRNRLEPLKQKQSVSELIAQISKPDVHRGIVVDEKGDLVNIITQSEVLQYISKNLAEIPELAEKTIAELGLDKKEVLYSIDHNKTALEAFQLMAKHGISSVPVLDDEKKLLAALTVKDIRGIATGEHLFDLLQGNIMKYFVTAHSDEADISAPVICVKAGDTFGKVLKQLVASKTLCSYVITEDKQLKGVITLGDLLSVLGSK